MPTQTTKAQCVVSVYVDCDSTWNPNCPVDQVVKQAKDDAIGRIRKLFSDAQCDGSELSTKRRGTHGLRLMDVTKVVVQLVEE